MSEFFFLHEPGSERLRAKGLWSGGPVEWVACPATPVHPRQNGPTRADLVPLEVEVKHNDRRETMIWTFARLRRNCLIHNSLLAEMVSRHFTGFTLRPATVRFRDGFHSQEYKQLIVTGWGGLARPESGIRLVDSCPGCLYKEYSPLIDPSRLLDPSQWSGEDFFKVWPLVGYILVTRKVTEFLATEKIRSYSAYGPAEAVAIAGGVGITVGSLADNFPEDLALKYGRPLGIA
jgi:hypothetical protein